MDIFFEIITPIISCVLNYACMLYFFGAMSSGKQKKILSPVGVTSFFVFLFTMFFVKEPVVRLLLLTLATFSYTYLFVYKLYNRIFITVAYIALSAIGENITTYLALLFFNINFYKENSGTGFLVATVASKLLSFVILYFVVLSKRQLLYGSFKLSWLSLYTLPFATTFASITMYHVLAGFTPNAKLNMMGLASMVMLIVSNIFIFRIVDKMRKDAEYESRLEYADELVKRQSEQYDALFKSNREVYSIQHDNKNFLLGVVSELKSENTDTALLMLKERIDGITQKETEVITGNSVVDTVLSYKLYEADRKNIEVEFEHKNAGALKISGVDFAVLIGNAIDNAMEACAELPENERHIKVVIVVVNDIVNISITNNVKENINSDALKTSKINPDRHGFGIINIKSVATKYGGDVVFECHDKVFKTMIMVNNAQV